MRRTAPALSLRLCLAFVLGLVASCTKSDPEPVPEGEAAEKSAVSDEALVLDLWAGVPPLTPTGDEIASELEPRPGPPKPKSVSETIEVPFPAPGPSAPATPPPTGEKVLEVERFGPTGDAALVDAVRVSFSQPMVPLADVETLAAKKLPFEIDPLPPGEPKWMGTKTVAYMSKSRFPYSTTYTVTVPAGVESTNGAKLAAAKKWTFSTPVLEVLSSSPHDGERNVGLKPEITLSFNQAVQRVPVLAKLKLRGGGSSVQLEEVPLPTPPTDEAGKARESRVVRLRPKTSLRPNTSYALSLPAGVFGEGPNRSSAKNISFSTYPPLKLSMAPCPSPCWTSNGINVTATTSISDPRLKEKVRIEPEVEDMQVYAAYNGIRVSGSFEGLTKYSIEVDAGVTDSFGQSLAKPFKGKVSFGPLSPSLSPLIVGRSPAVIDKGPAALMTLRASGLSQLEIHARALGIDEIPSFLDAYWSDNYGWPNDRPEATYTNSFDVSDSERKIAKLNLDLNKILGGGKTSTIGWFTARSNEYESYGYKQRQAFTQMFEVTDLGITAALDNDGGTVMVTRFSDNGLVAGANVELFDREGKSVWAGETGADGLAQPAYSNSSPRFAVAKLGSDAAFLRVDQGDARSRWPSYGAQDDYPRAFFFTERTPYKPGEKIHLNGIIRLETRGPEGGIKSWRPGATGSYTVTNPRGIEVAKGDIKLSDFGSFSVDIQTKEEQGTGNFNFNLNFSSLFGSNRSFYHSIPVETFRTPEFEVKVQRPESKPLHFAQELVANVEANYLHGAPLIDADATYVVNRTDSGFTPPGDLNSGFTFGGASGSGFGRHSWYHWTPPARQVATGTGKTNAQGQLEIKHVLAEVDPPLTEAQKAAKKAAGETEAKDVPVSPATYSIQATVTDQNRQAIGANGSFVVHPADVYVGLRSDRTVLREGEKTNVQAVVTDLAGERVASVETSVDIIRKVTERKAVEKNGAWTFAYETTEETVSSCALQSRGVPVDCEVTAGKPGTYIVRGEAKDESGRATRTEMSIFVHGEEAVVWDDQKKRVDLVPDQKEYKPGDTIKLLVRSPFDEARGMVVVEREGIAKNIPLVVEGGATAVEIPVTETMIPGFTVSSILVKGRTEVAGAPPGLDLGMPAVATGLANITVSTASKKIEVELTPSATEIDPKGTLTLDVTTKDSDGKALPASMAIMVVDEGVLSLMNYQTPDPLSFFVRQRTGGVWLAALHANIMPRQDPSTEALNADEPEAEPEPDAAFAEGGLGLIGNGYGGGGAPGDGAVMDEAEEMAPPASAAPAPMEAKKMDKSRARPKGKSAANKDRSQRARRVSAGPSGFDASAAMAQSVSLRTLFATTAFFDPKVRTDASGKATIEIEMPENLTSFRVMAVAIDPATSDRFGSADTTVRVRKPIMIRPSLPRFANFGDRFEASVMVDNQTGTDQKVLVGTRGLNVALTSEDQKFVDIAAGTSKEVRFDMAAAEVGTMRLQFAAMSAGGRDATEISLPVRFPATAQAFADYGMTSDSIEREIEPPAKALPGYGGLELTFSSTALSGLEDAVQYLVDYEYECAEQTASRMLPIFVLGDILGDFPIASVRDKTSRALLARGGIRKLWDKQGYDGGFGYWKSEESWPYVSTWATFALLEGKRAGYDVDEAKLNRALDYVENFVRYGHKTRWGTYYDATTRAFGLWLLSREGRGAGLFPIVWAKRDKLPLYARAMLMSTADRYKKTSERDEILAELREAVVESPRTIHFVEGKSEADADGLRVLMHSNVQTDAIVLMAMLEVAPADPMLPKVIAGILSERDPQRGGRWTTTHANAWALLAAARYYETVEAEEPDFAARVWIDAAFAGQFDFKGRSMSKQQQEIPMKALLASGAQKLILGKEGPGKLYYRMGLTYAPEDLKLDAQEQGFVVYREYEALANPGEEKPDPEAVKRMEDGGWVVKAGTNVKVTINLVVRDRANYVVVDDGLPAGFEGQNPRFVTSVGTAPSSSRDIGSHRRWWYRWWTFDHTDMRDDRMLLFADHLPAGVYTYTYTARATSIGEFQLPPIKAEAMYEPERFGHSSSSTVRVVE